MRCIGVACGVACGVTCVHTYLIDDHVQTISDDVDHIVHVWKLTLAALSLGGERLRDSTVCRV